MLFYADLCRFMPPKRAPLKSRSNTPLGAKSFPLDTHPYTQPLQKERHFQTKRHFSAAGHCSIIFQSSLNFSFDKGLKSNNLSKKNFYTLDATTWINEIRHQSKTR